MTIGDPPPFYPAWGWQWAAPAYTPPPCDHCLCLDDASEYERSDRTLPHRRCCHCRKLYAVPAAQETDPE